MKKIFAVCFFTLTIGGFMNAQNTVALTDHSSILNWQQSFGKAQKLTKSEKKPLLIFFTGSDWCGPCKKLVADFFESEKFKKIADAEFILYEADFPRNKDLVSDSQKKDNVLLKQKYKISSFPTIVIIDVEGKVLGKKKGYNLMRDTSYHYSFIESVLKR